MEKSFIIVQNLNIGKGIAQKAKYFNIFGVTLVYNAAVNSIINIAKDGL